MITIYFGSPGSGKTTLAVRELIYKKSFYSHVFCNFATSVAPHVDLARLGEWTFPKNSFIAIDEAGIEYNNRNFKSFPKEAIKWFKLHRHFSCDLALYSQSWEDCDITIRRLADRLYYIKKLGPFTISRRVYKRVRIDKNTEQIIDGYKMVSMVWLLFKPLYYLSYLLFGLGFALKYIFPFDEVKLIWRKRYYKYFDTLEAPPLPVLSC